MRQALSFQVLWKLILRQSLGSELHDFLFRKSHEAFLLFPGCILCNALYFLGLGHMISSDPAEAILLEAAGCRPDRRPALPHVTLARPGRKDARKLAPVMHQWMATAPVPQSHAVLNKIALYTWAEDRSTRLFQVVAEQELGEVS